jgi:hypothetical protein
MLARWLTSKHINPCPYKKFGLTDLSEHLVVDPDDPDDAIVSYIGDLLINSHGDPQMIADDIAMLLEDAEMLELNIVEDYIKNRVLPKKAANPTRIGNFGEILATQCLIDFTDFEFPIYKLRYREKRNWAMRLTDLFLVKKQNNGRILICYGEVKTRSGVSYTSSVKKVAVEAHDSLKKDVAVANPEILDFVRKILYAQGKLEEARIFGRIQNNRIKYDITHILFLVHDNSIWKDEILSELEQHNIDNRLKNLNVNVLRINKLSRLIDQTYENAWRGIVIANA